MILYHEMVDDFSTNNDESQAKQQLHSLGYHAAHHSRSRDPSPRPSPNVRAQHRTTSPKPVAPAPPSGPSETQKNMSQYYGSLLKHNYVTDVGDIIGLCVGDILGLACPIFEMQ